MTEAPRAPGSDAGATSRSATLVLPSRGFAWGARQIVLFNWPVYAIAIAGFGLALAGSVWSALPDAVRSWSGVVAIGVLAATSWTVVAAYLVYDVSGLHGWAWLRPPQKVGHWVNIHAGLDEASEALAALFPDATKDILDIYDGDRMTEPAIRVARRMGHVQPEATHAPFWHLPVADVRADLVVLFFAAHELRRHEDRVRLLRETRRILAPSGRIVVVKHLRDGWNLLAFGPGAFHFLPRRAWMKAFEEAGLSVRDARSIATLVLAVTLEAKS